MSQDFNVVMFVERNITNNLSKKVLVSINAGKMYNMLDLLTDSEIFTNVARLCNITIDEIDGIPVIVYIPSTTKEDRLKYDKITYHYDISQIEAKISKTNLAFAEAVKLKLKDINFFPKASFEDICFCFDTILHQFQPYFQNELAIYIRYRVPFINPYNIPNVKASINKMNLSVSDKSKYISSFENESVKQTSPTGKFFIKLPDYEKFKGNVFLSEPLIPDIRTIFLPFSHPAYYSPHWMKLIDKSENARVNYLSKLDPKYDIQIRKKDHTEWISYPEEYIIGNIDNDDLPIMDNEVDYYNALIKFIRYDLEQNVEPETAQKLFDEGSLTPDMQEYINELINNIAYLNWSCSGKFTKIPFSLDDENDDMVFDTSETSPDFLYYHFSNRNGYDGMELLKNYINKIARGDNHNKPKGGKIYAEAIIKLARWGERRPSTLKFAGEETMFSLRTFMDLNQTINIDKLITKMVNGCPLSLVGYITLKWVVNDKNYISSMEVTNIVDVPIGFITKKEFECEKPISQIVYISLLDVISEYLSGNQFIDGITMDNNGVFSVKNDMCHAYSENLEIAVKNALEEQAFTIFTSKHLEKVAVETKVNAKRLTDLVAISRASCTVGAFSNWFKGLPVTDFNYLTQILSDGQMPLLSIMQMSVLKHVLPAFLHYNNTYKPIFEMKEINDEDIDFGEILNIFYDTAERLSIRAITEFYQLNDQGSKSDNKIIDKLAKFGGVVNAETDSSTITNKDKLESEKHESVIAKSSNESEENLYYAHNCYVVKDYKVTGEYAKIIVNLKSKNKVLDGKTEVKSCFIGYYATADYINNNNETTKIGIIFAIDELPESAVVSSKSVITIEQFSTTFLRMLSNIMLNKEPSPLICAFASKNTALSVLKQFISERQKVL